MVQDTVAYFCEAGVKKSSFLNRSLSRYFVLASLAGLFVGLGIMLIFSIGAPLAETPFKSVVMGASFGIALSFVMFAGSELFTGGNMIMTISFLNRRVKLTSALKLWGVCWLGNFFGASLLMLAARYGNLFCEGSVEGEFLASVALSKGSYPFMVLFIRGVLCNILICLAVWMTGRTQSDSAKLILIFWALFAFIGIGLEHSIANMTLIGVAAVQNSAVGIQHLFYNLLPSTLGNIFGGAFVGLAYWYVGSEK